MIIREIRTDDARNFIDLINEVESNADFMLMEKGERQTPPEQQYKLLERFKSQDNSTVLVAEDKNKLIGYIIARGGSAKRTKHAAKLVIGILRQHRGNGVGSKLFKNLIKWAEENNLSRLELTVVKDNLAGINLYRKYGFEIEGTKKRSLIINDKPYNEYYMAKLL